MFKRVVAMGLCAMILCAGSAFAADVNDPVASIKCDIQGRTTNNSINADYYDAYSVATVSGRPANQVKTIYAQVDISNATSGVVYATNQSTEQNKVETRTSARATRGWNQSKISVVARGIARARYTNNNVSHANKSGLTTTIGGRNLSRAVAEESTVIPASNEPDTFGNGKGDKMAAVIQTMFGHDLSDYQYISFSELWETEDLSGDLEKIKEILMDRYIGIKVGEFIPMGFLYKDSTAYTVVEQSDGSVVLSEYKLLDENDASVAAAQSEECEAETSVYLLVGTEKQAVDRALMDSLYQ